MPHSVELPTDAGGSSDGNLFFFFLTWRNPQTRARPVWMPDSASTVCTLAHCSAPIGVGSRHHCRACGALVCGNCSRERLILRHLGYHHPERVCDRCVAQFRQPLVPQPVVYPVYQQQQPAVQQFYQAVPPMAYGYGAPQPAPPAYGYGAAAPPPYGASPPYNAPPPAYHSPNQDPYALAYAKPSAPPM